MDLNRSPNLKGLSPMTVATLSDSDGMPTTPGVTCGPRSDPSGICTCESALHITNRGLLKTIWSRSEKKDMRLNWVMGASPGCAP